MNEDNASSSDYLIDSHSYFRVSLRRFFSFRRFACEGTMMADNTLFFGEELIDVADVTVDIEAPDLLP